LSVGRGGGGADNVPDPIKRMYTQPSTFDSFQKDGRNDHVCVHIHDPERCSPSVFRHNLW
jgi:hypothetical protein